MVPLHKKDDPAVPGNYRGVTLLNVIGKIYARVLNTRLAAIAEPRIAKEQAGFITGRSTVDQVFILSDVIGRFRANGKNPRPLYIAFLDIAKAYDTVWRDALWYKMDKMGVPRKLRKVIEELVSDSVVSVRINGERSGSFTIRIGLRQGCVLSPLLFDIYINDFFDEVKSATAGVNIHLPETASKHYHAYYLHSLLFADDVALLADSPEKLQHLLDRFSHWCNKWRMVISVPKSKFMVLNHPEHLDTPSFSIPDRGELERVSEFKYLGVWLSEDGTWDVDAKKKLARYNEACRAAHAVLHNRLLKLWTRTRVWAALCRPHLEYAAEVIRLPEGSRTWKKLCSAQFRTLKSILGLPASTANELVLAETALASLPARYEQAHLSYRVRLLHGTNNVLPREIFERPWPRTNRRGDAHTFLNDPELIRMSEHVVSQAKAEMELAIKKCEEARAKGRTLPPPPPMAELLHNAIVELIRTKERRRQLEKVAGLKAPCGCLLQGTARHRQESARLLGKTARRTGVPPYAYAARCRPIRGSHPQVWRRPHEGTVSRVPGGGRPAGLRDATARSL